MPKYAQFDSTQTAITPVIGYYDTDDFSYPNMPAEADLYLCTPAEWAERMTGLWGINPVAVTKTLLPYTPPAPTLAQAQATQTSAILSAAQAALLAIVASYPQMEIATWQQQYAEALAVTASSTAATPTLAAIATTSGDTVASLAASVIAKATAYQAASGAIIGRRVKLCAEIAAATTVAAVQAINW